MRFLVVALCLVFCSHQVASWRIWGGNNEEAPEVIVPEEPVNATLTAENVMSECLRAGREGRCEFYECLENRFHCGNNGYTNKISKHFCRKIDQAFPTFDAFGKLWLNKTSICLMREMLSMYSGPSTTCAAIKQAGIDGIINCNNEEIDFEGQQHGFCHFIRTNRREYSNLMGVDELNLLRSLGNVEIWQSMITQGMSCGARIVGQAIREIGQSVLDLTSNLGRSISNWVPWN